MKNGAERRVGFRLLSKVLGNGDVHKLRGMAKCRDVEGFSFLAPLANLTNFRNDGILGFGGRVVNQCAPQTESE